MQIDMLEVARITRRIVLAFVLAILGAQICCFVVSASDAPTVIQLTLSDHYITNSDVGDTFVITIDYSEPMLPTAPLVLFSPGLNTTLSFQAGSSGWFDTDTYVARYTILDGNVTVMDDDLTVIQAQDLEGNVQVAYNYDDLLDVDTENPYFHDFAVIGGAVDDQCLRVVTFTAKATDPNGTMHPGDVTVTSATVTNATIGSVYDVIQTSDSQTTITVTGKVDVTALTGCPARVTILLDAVDSVDNEAAQQTQSDDAIDTTIPVVQDLRFDTDATHAVEQCVPYLVDECGLVTVYFSGNVTDNCCIVPANVSVTATLPTGNAILESINISCVQTAQGHVDITGSAVVRCLDGPDMVRVQVYVTAWDCCGNAAVPVSTWTGEGLVDDIILPIPRDDPRQDMPMDESASIDPSVAVRMDEVGTYRLVLRENTPVRIDVMGNDADNLTHNNAHPFAPCSECGPCGGPTGCCATMFIDQIVKRPDHGSVLIEDDRGDCNGGTVIRYAPDRGYLGPDDFTYRIRDVFGNVSAEIATVYLQIAPKLRTSDATVSVCQNGVAEIRSTLEDLLVNPDDPTVLPFEVSIVGGPEHGILIARLEEVTYTPSSTGTDRRFHVVVSTLSRSESAAVELTYVPAVGYVGNDLATVNWEDFSGDSEQGVVSFAVFACACDPCSGLVFKQGERIAIFLNSDGTLSNPGSQVPMALVRTGDAQAYEGASSYSRDPATSCSRIDLDLSGVPIGDYMCTLALDNGEVVRMEVTVITDEP